MKWICILCSLSLLSCDYLFLSGVPRGGIHPPAPPIGVPPLPGTSAPQTSPWGVVKCSQAQASFFQKQVRQFLTSFIDIKAVGRVGCTAQDAQLRQGGFFFKGQVSFQSGEVFTPTPNFTQVLHPTEGSYIELHISAVSGPAIPSIRLSLSPAGGLVEDNIVSLSFEDQRGVVILDGHVVTGGLFAGEFRYENFTDYQGTSAGGFSGTIGTFSIQACSFLNCFATNQQGGMHDQ